MQRCPCGFYGDPKRECRCSPNVIAKYRNKISGPLLDRIDIHVEVPAVKYKEMAGGSIKGVAYFLSSQNAGPTTLCGEYFSMMRLRSLNRLFSGASSA